MKMPRKTLLSLCLAAAVGLQPSPAAAEQKVEARRSAAADALVEIENPAGSIRVIGWERGEVMVTGDLGAGASGLDFTGSGSRIRVGVDTERNPHGVVSSREVHVPARSRLQIESFAGSITVEGVSGTVSGETVNGSITVSGQAREIAAESVNGAVQVSGASTHTKAESVNGSVVVRGASGDLEAPTVNGRLEVSGGDLQRAPHRAVAAPPSFRKRLGAEARLATE